MKRTFYSNGKLLLTGEYTVLDGAKALALPTKQGQYLDVENNETGEIQWQSYDSNGAIWFQADINFKDIIKNVQEAGSPVANTLIGILHEAYMQNPDIIDAPNGYKVTTRLTFPREWGLGTSSTLINNIAQWFGIDAYRLLWKSFGGSGYDIACAQHNTPVIYQIQNNTPIVTPVRFKREFINNIYFVYLNQKQNSRSAIASYREKRKDSTTTTINEINRITDSLLETENINDFTALLEKHERIMHTLLSEETVKQKLFPDFKGTVKSLGAWGGDFVIAVSQENPTDYFNNKGYRTVIPYADMIL